MCANWLDFIFLNLSLNINVITVFKIKHFALSLIQSMNHLCNIASSLYYYSVHAIAN